MAGKPFRFVNEYTVFTLPWEVGILEGLFEKEGIEVEIAAKNPPTSRPSSSAATRKSFSKARTWTLTTSANGGPAKRLRALPEGKVKAAALMEPSLSFALHARPA